MTGKTAVAVELTALEKEIKKIELALKNLDNPKNRPNYPQNLVVARSIRTHLETLDFFYNRLVEKQVSSNPNPDPSKTFYNSNPRPKEGEVAYFNLGTGYPKELHNGHYCYVLKDYKTKFLVIPTTSVKDNTEPDPDFEFDIQLGTLKNNTGAKSSLKPNQKSRLQLSDVRSVDLQRINLQRGIYTVSTPTSDVNDFLKAKLF